MRGRFISFEGSEGSGKSTQAARLVERLQAEGCATVRAREPGGTRTGEIIRAILQNDLAGEPLCGESEVLLFAASRAQLVHRVILPALERGEWVVCDRFADSTTAYQGYGRGFGVERMLEINAFAAGGAVPDLTILLDVDVATGFERLRARRSEAGAGGLDRIEREAASFHERVRRGYLELASRWPERFRVVDTLPDADVVHARVWSLAKELLSREA